jgi:hypothetical protein
MTSTTLIRWGNPPTGVHNTPIYLSLQTGTFKVPGVQIEARDNLTGADYTEALVAGTYDMGHIGTPPLFAALVRTQKYQIVGLGLVQYPPFYLMAPASVSSVRDLAGQVVTLNKLRTCPHSIIRTLLRWEGMEEDQVRLATVVEGEAIVCRVESDPSMRRGLVALPHGYGQSYPDGAGGRIIDGPRLNLITAHDDCDPIAATPYHKNVAVHLAPVVGVEAKAAEATSARVRAVAAVHASAA